MSILVHREPVSNLELALFAASQGIEERPAGLDYCGIVWLSVFGLFMADIFAVVLVLIKVKIVWLRIVVLMAGVTLLLFFAFILVFSGYGLV